MIESMIKEIKAAASYWSNHLYEFVPIDQINQFKQKLENELNERYAHHWYENEPIRGSAYRAIISDYVQTDPILVKCAQQVGIDMVCFNVSMPREVVCWVNPGSVTVRKVVNQKHVTDEIIYMRRTSSPQQQQQQQTNNVNNNSSNSNNVNNNNSSSAQSSPLTKSGNATNTTTTTARSAVTV